MRGNERWDYMSLYTLWGVSVGREIFSAPSLNPVLLLWKLAECEHRREIDRLKHRNLTGISLRNMPQLPSLTLFKDSTPLCTFDCRQLWNNIHCYHRDNITMITTMQGFKLIVLIVVLNWITRITVLNCPFIGSKISDWTVWDRRRQTQEYSQCAHPQPQKGGWTVINILSLCYMPSIALAPLTRLLVLRFLYCIICICSQSF